jgi:hypothetical protein
MVVIAIAQLLPATDFSLGRVAAPPMVLAAERTDLMMFT